MKLINSIVKLGIRHEMKDILNFMSEPVAAQKNILEYLLQKAQNTTFGKEHHFKSIRNYQDFKQQIPIRDYEAHKPYIQQMMQGQKNILWPGAIKWFSRSSGTTSDRSKYIPLSKENLTKCHLKGSHSMIAMWFYSNPNTQIFRSAKGIIMGGDLSPFDQKAKTYVGDVSAIMIKNMPSYARYFLAPNLATALIKDWEIKIEKIARAVLHENITNTSGVPTWSLILLRRILALSGKSNLSEVFPNFELYIHGGVNFEPYRSQFETLFPSPKVGYRNSYNASEGFFAGQLLGEDKGMLLFLNSGVFYEFVPLSELSKEQPKAYSIGEVSLGVNYAMVISTTAGLWRYLIGDTIQFTHLYPHKIEITGRTAQYINAFGEELMVWNTDKALIETCQTLGAKVADYTAAPLFLSASNKGGHQWLIEFEKQPPNIAIFAQLLDENLQKNNSDYAAKRYKDIALKTLEIEVLPSGSFHKWLKSKGKFGGQNKVPRLSDSRQLITEILNLKK